jgi:hypothetical protein
VTRVLGVHGVGNYRPGMPESEAARQLADTWMAALLGGLGPTSVSFDVKVAYYAPHLREGQTAQGLEEDPDRLDPLIQNMIMTWIKQCAPPAQIAMGQLTKPLRAALEWVADHQGLDQRLTRLFIIRFFREVSTYLTGNPGIRQRARDAVTAAVVAHRPSVVIAHSLGSVLAYEALWARPLPVELLLTVGSPLGMPDIIFPRLQPSPINGFGKRPSCVTRWVNLADPGDLIAIPKHLSTRFHGIDTDLEPTISAWDFHRARNYLTNPATAATVSPYLRRA